MILPLKEQIAKQDNLSYNGHKILGDVRGNEAVAFGR